MKKKGKIMCQVCGAVEPADRDFCRYCGYSFKGQKTLLGGVENNKK